MRDGIQDTFDEQSIAALKGVIAEAEAYDADMEQRGFHTGGPPDIEGVYDSRVWLLAGGAKRLLEENARLRFWLDIATSKGSIPDHSQDAEDRAWFGLACRFSNLHMPSNSEAVRLDTEYGPEALSDARENG